MRQTRSAAALLAATALALAVGAREARPAKSDQVTISMLAVPATEPAYQVLISNFERVYPDVTVQTTYAPAATIASLEPVELAAGNAPDLLYSAPGCGTTTSVCVLAKSGYLAPMVRAPWTRRSLRAVVSLSKVGQGLFTFVPGVGVEGMFTNDALFAKLGLSVPQTFSQLLTVCQKAQADGATALVWDGGSGPGVYNFIQELAVATVYGQDSGFTPAMKAGTASFAGSAGWHQALQELVEMNAAGCFEPGVAGTSQAAGWADFVQGQSLMLSGNSSDQGSIAALDPQFSYGLHLFPSGTSATETRTFFNLSAGLAVNAHSSPAVQAAAQEFVNFVARPAQDALYAEQTGSLTQYEIQHREIPPFMASMAPAIAQHDFVVSPSASFSNPGVVTTLEQDGIGLVTGQETVDDVLQAMDAAWKQGPG